MRPYRTIFLDLDGVLVDFFGASIKLLDIQDRNVRIKIINDVQLESLAGVSRKEFIEMMTEDWWANLPMTEYAQDILDFLALERVLYERVCILTARVDSDDPIHSARCINGKIRWMSKHTPDVPYFIGKPKHFCASKGTILIDDFRRNVSRFRAHGGDAYLVQTPYNTPSYTKETSMKRFQEYMVDHAEPLVQTT